MKRGTLFKHCYRGKKKVCHSHQPLLDIHQRRLSGGGGGRGMRKKRTIKGEMVINDLGRKG